MKSWILLALVACVATQTSCKRGGAKGTSKGAPDAALAAEPNQAERQRPVATLAPVADLTAPLTGAEADDADGYPRQYVDRAVVRGMLAAQKYADLSALFAKLQDAFEKNSKREGWLMDAADAFGSAEPELTSSLGAWVAASPESFAPYLARGTHLTAVAFARRGGRFAKDTAPDDLAAMHEAVASASADLDKALALRPKLVAALREKMVGRNDDEETFLARALAICPTCVRVRVTHMYGLTPRWGGPYEAMDAFAKDSAKQASTPPFKVLAGFADLDRAEVLQRAKKEAEALTAVNRALAAGEAWEFLRERAQIEMSLDDWAHARTDIDRAASMRPGLPDILTMRAYVSMHEKKYELAATDVRDTLRMNPTDGDARNLMKTIPDGLLWEAQQHALALRDADALRVIDLGLELSPENAKLRQKRAEIVAGQVRPPQTIAELEDAVRLAPDDFAANQRLGYALGHAGKLDRMVEVWTAYLARHPDDGNAYVARSGAYHHLGRKSEALADVKQACAHGSAEGCARVKQLSAIKQ